MKSKKRILIFLLAFILFISEFSGIALAMSNTLNQNEISENDNLDIDENEKVRVIVELKSNSLLEEAISSGQKYEELSQSFKDDKKEKLKKEQDELIENLEKENIETNLSGVINYDTALNGVGLTVRQKDIESIEENPNVRNIYYSEEFERPLLKTQQEIIGANKVWDTYKYKGEGTVIAVIDTGIDVDHKAMVLDDNKKVKLTKESVDNIISENNLKGKYFTEKVPYGYNYYDFSHNLKDSYGNMHGMHVSGIVGSNSKETNTFGVAPNSQILAMKVFSDDVQYPTTFTDIWLKALDDAIKLNADVVNLSLGSPAGFNIDHDKSHPELQIFSKARKAGIVISVAVGNETNINYGAVFGSEARAENYDTGLVANPAINEDTFAVASLENIEKRVYAISWNATEERSEDVNLFIPAGIKENIVAKVIDLKEAKEFDSLKDKNGRNIPPTENLPDVEGKIVLAKWPDSTDRKDIFEDTLNNIALKKPKAILLGRPDDKIAGRLVLRGEVGKLVYGIIKNSTYRSLATLPMLERLKVYDTNVTINIKQKVVNNPKSMQMSEFSTWGPTPDLRIKPEITGVGGNIYSTIENDEYRNMSGTSMASPQVAGASLILKQYLDENNIGDNNKSELIKTILMNTATQILDPNSENGQIPYFVRRQGAGLLNLENALKSKAYAEVIGTNDNFYDAKLELRQLKQKKFSAKIKITNISDEQISFIPKIIAIREKIENGYRKEIPLLVDGKLSVDEKITLNAKEQKTIDLSYDFSNSNLEEDNFIEGFIILQSDEVDLSIPFLGFYGDWGNQRAIDSFALPEYKKEKRNGQFVINPDENGYSSRFITKLSNPLPIINDTVFFAPESEYFPQAGVSIAPLRNMEEIEYSILDGSDMKLLRVIGKSFNVRKLNKLNKRNSFVTMPESFWDGYINGKEAQAEKLYIYQMKVKLNNGGYGSDEQIYQYPIMIDNKKPTIDKNEIYLTKLSDRMLKLNLSVEDKGTGVRDLYIQTVGFVNDIENPDDFIIDNTPPGTIKSSDNESLNENKKINSMESFDLENNEDLALSKNGNFPFKPNIVEGMGKAKYGRFVALHFINQKPNHDNYEIVKDGKVVINPDDYNFDQYDVNIPVYLNGYDGKIEVEIPIKADKTHLEIASKDHISNMESFRIETGFEENFNAINFPSYIYSIEKHKMKLFIDGIEINDASQLPYFTDKKELKIKIDYKSDDVHLSHLTVKNGKNIDAIIRDSVVGEDISKKYDFKYDDVEKSIEFTIKDIKSSFDIITTAKDGSMKYDTDKKDINIDLSKVDLTRFKKILVSNQEYDLGEIDKKIQTTSGQKVIEMIFSDDIDKQKDTQIESIIVKDKNGETNLNRGEYFDIVTGGKIGFSASTYSININYEFNDDSTIIINFKKNGDSSIVENDKLSITDLDDKENQNADNKNPYPAVFVSTPSLLSILNEFNTSDNKIRLNGFVGYVNSDDFVKSMDIYLVDNLGNKISEGISLGKDDFYFSEGYDYGNLYSQSAYMFGVELDLIDKFNINIKFDVETQNGIKASMVRRVLYDRILPTLEYIVEPRELNLDKATIRLKSTDDSIDLSLFKNDSLIERVNTSSISFESDLGVKIEKEIDIDLDYGQNEITFSAKDLSGKVTTKTIYIYRAFEEDVKVEDEIELSETSLETTNEENIDLTEESTEEIIEEKEKSEESTEEIIEEKEKSEDITKDKIEMDVLKSNILPESLKEIDEENELKKNIDIE